MKGPWRRLAVVIVAWTMLGVCEAQPLRLYVSGQGKDTWSGTLAEANEAKTDGPFATLQRARDEIRKRKPKGATVLVRGGVYELPETLVLGAEDGGTADAPVVYRAFEKETPILRGARAITGFVPHEGKVLKADVGAQGFKDVYFRQLFLNGKRQHLARHPNFDPARPYCGGWLYVGGKAKDIYKEEAQKRLLAFKEADVRRYAEPHRGEVDIYAYRNWSNCIIPIQSIDYEKGIMTLTRDAHRGVRLGNRYYLRNFREDLDAPGEWFLDKDTSTLYFRPPAPLENAVVSAPYLDRLISIDRGAAHITVQGFTLEHCDGTAIRLGNASSCLIAGNTIRCTGGGRRAYGIEIQGGANNGASGNDVSGTGGNGIVVRGGDTKTLTPAGNYADNNYVHHTGYFDGHGMGCTVGGVGNRIAHNLIHDCGRCGIFGGGSLHVIEYNRIRHCNLKTCDTGGIYICGATSGWVPKGTVVRHNFITDILGYGRIKHKGEDVWISPHYAWGIYLDDGYSGAHVYGNVVARTPYDGIFIHGGRENIIENNIIVNCTSGQMIYSAWTPPPDLKERIDKNFLACRANPAYKRFPGFDKLDVGVVPLMADNTFVRNIAYYAGPKSCLYRQRKLVLEKTTSDHNLAYHFGLPLLVGLKAPPEKQWDAWREMGFDTHSVVADPLFVDPAKDDYRLRPESPAFGLGFKAIPMEKIGPYKHPLRASWPIQEADGVRERPLKCDRRPTPVKPLPRNTTPVKVNRAAKPPTLDGVATEGEWAGKEVPLKQTPGRQPIKGAPCTARVSHDEQCLYVIVSVPTSKVVRSSEWGKADAAEVCFQDLSGPKPGPIFVVQGFADGSLRSSTEAGAPEGDAKKLGEGSRFAAKVDAERWTGEWAIPFACANLQPRPGAKLAFNIGIRRTQTGEWINWVGTMESTWQLDAAGFLVLE